MNMKIKIGAFHLTLNINRKKDLISKYIDLAPVDNADKDGNYCQAIDYAINNDRIKNIALTGPYGSGKSSLIKTFEKNNAYKFLNISLASFKEELISQELHPDKNERENAENIRNTLIERSILQQMLYGASANKLPYSRFKRITTPDLPLIKSFILLSWFFSSLFLWLYGGNAITSATTSELHLWLPLWISFSLSIPVLLISDIYKASFSISLKKISLANAEIETGDIAENSILNKHLDEIIYFFQSTKYHVVVFEDLDRFGSPEIFVKLREINRLINENDRTTGNIKFLYALKDDMFSHNDRAKFFDFIIPVVPIINSSNSLDKIQERISLSTFSQKIEPQFLRETSLYLDDLRLIHNIFNEFNIYSEKLKSDNLNATKLLAMMIYKNAYPNDFEKLHHGDGALSHISKKRVSLVQSTIQQLDSLISETKQGILDSEREVETSINNLIKSFIGHLVLQFPDHKILHIKVDGEPFSLSQLFDWETFERIIQKNKITVTNQYQNYHPQNSEISVQEVNEILNEKSNFTQRKINIENKAREKREGFEQKIAKLEHEKIEASQTPLYKLLQENDPSLLEEIINEESLSSPNLFIYLVKNGYIDETYHLYTSNFHEGRMTLNDRDFLLTIRDFNTPDPLQVIDTPEEICNNMRDEDFSHIYVLNVILMDFLLKNKKSKSAKLNAALNYIANNFNKCDPFFSAYWASGTHIHELTMFLSEQWPAYSISCLNSINAAQHIALIISHVSAEKIADKMNDNNALTKYISENGISVFSSDKLSLGNYKPIKLLDVKFKDLSLLNDKKDLIDFVHQHNLYEINSCNILYLMAKYSKDSNTEPHSIKNLSSLSQPGCEQIKEYISSHLPEYIDNVFLQLPGNTKENEKNIKSLLENSSLSDELKKQALSKQDIIFDDFSNISCEWWEQIISEDKITPSWKNITDYLSSAEADTELATQKIQENNWLHNLKNSSLKSEINDETQREATSTFIFENDKIEIAAYKILIVNLPYIWHDFPDVSIDKQIALAIAKKVKLTNESFASSSNDVNLMAALIENNLTDYLSDKENYPINDATIEQLLGSNISKENKITFCHDITLNNIKSNSNLVKCMVNILSPDDVDCSNIDQNVMSELILRAQKTENKIQLLNKYIERWKTNNLIAILKNLPDPYCDIVNYGKRPRINKNDIKLAKLLEANDFISTFTETEAYIQINTYKSADHSHQ